MSSDAVHSFGPDLTIYQAQEAREQLRDAWAAGVRRYDLGQTVNLDTSGAQLLVALHKQAIAAGEPIEITAMATEAREMLALLGIKSLTLGTLPMEIPA